MLSLQQLHANASYAYMQAKCTYVMINMCTFEIVMIGFVLKVFWLACCTAKKVDHLALEHPRFSPTNRHAVPVDMHAGNLITTCDSRILYVRSTIRFPCFARCMH